MISQSPFSIIFVAHTNDLMVTEDTIITDPFKINYS